MFVGKLIMCAISEVIHTIALASSIIEKVLLIVSNNTEQQIDELAQKLLENHYR